MLTAATWAQRKTSSWGGKGEGGREREGGLDRCLWYPVPDTAMVSRVVRFCSRFRAEATPGGGRAGGGTGAVVDFGLMTLLSVVCASVRVCGVAV